MHKFVSAFALACSAALASGCACSSPPIFAPTDAGPNRPDVVRVPPIQRDAAEPTQLEVDISADGLVVELHTIACDGTCADVEAVVYNGQAPFAFTWNDTSLDGPGPHHVCPAQSTDYAVHVVDSGGTVEFGPRLEGDGRLYITLESCPSDVDVYWTEWTRMTAGEPGTAAGTLDLPGSPIGVAMAGEVGSASAITGQPTSSTIGPVTFTPASTFLGATVSTRPPETGMIVNNSNTALTQTIVFSQPVRNPMLAIMSLGNAFTQARWTFDATPTVVSGGPHMIGGFPQGSPLTVSGESVIGSESNGIVEFVGTFSSLSFTVATGEGAGGPTGVHSTYTVGVRGRP